MTFSKAPAPRVGAVSARRGGPVPRPRSTLATAGVGSQVFNYNAKVYTDQPTPPAGTYLDNVVLDVGF